MVALTVNCQFKATATDRDESERKKDESFCEFTSVEDVYEQTPSTVKFVLVCNV